jgi:hypothetical protein
LKIFLTISKLCGGEEFIVPKAGLVDGIVHQIGKAVPLGQADAV